MTQRDTLPASLRHCVINKLQVIKSLKEGTNARLIEAKWEGLFVVVKDLEPGFDQISDHVSEQEFQMVKRVFLRECELSSRLCHPNIVRFLGIYFPPSSSTPSIVMEHLYCDLASLLKENASISLELKLSTLHSIGLGLRYLHTRESPVVLKNLSSESVLVSEGLEVKISDFSTARFIDTKHCSLVVDFMPPEVYANDGAVIGKETDVFSFGCIMIHTLSHQWPTPAQNMINCNDPSGQTVADSSSEIERRSQYLDKVPKSVEDVTMPLITSCLENVPVDRPTAEEVCDQLETLVVNRQSTLPDNLLQAQLRLQEAEKQQANQAAKLCRATAELLSKDTEVQHLKSEVDTLTSEVSKLKISSSSQPAHLQTSKSSVNFWSSFKLTWQQCADLPEKRWVTSVAELDGLVYIAVMDGNCSYTDPLVYNCNKDQWAILPTLPCAKFSLVAVHCKKQVLAIGGITKHNNEIIVCGDVFLWDQKGEWLTTYPDMPTKWYISSAISHQLRVIVAGGIPSCDHTNNNPAVTNAVEILNIDNTHPIDSYWSTVEPLPHALYSAIPLVVDDQLYIAVGYDRKHHCTCGIVTASLPELLQSSSNTCSGQVWDKLPDMPYASFSVSHYQGRLVTFTGDHQIERPDEDKPVFELAPHIHIYNADTKSWDYVGDVPCGYYIGRSVHIREDKILFIGGLTGTHDPCSNDDLVTTCSVLTFT